jgi:hypothetical protein
MHNASQTYTDRVRLTTFPGILAWISHDNQYLISTAFVKEEINEAMQLQSLKSYEAFNNTSWIELENISTNLFINI